jgi:DNA processing protein
VGTRKATSEGKRNARILGATLAQRGFCVVSGLALGIDEAAHEGALSVEGKTVAVLANGLDTIYPREHEHLAKKIITAGGAIISEYAAGTPALPHQFLERNRIVSGISIAVVVIEAPLRSGSISTARHAAEQGRDVFVYPGPVTHVNYRGSHMLIRNGARLVSSPEDILEDLNVSLPEKEMREQSGIERFKNDPVACTIFHALSENQIPMTIDKLSELTTLEPRTLAECISLLVIEGVIREDRNGGFTITSL